MTPLRLTCFTAVSAVGRGLAETWDSMQRQRSGLAPCAFETVDVETHVGEVAGVDATALPEGLQRFNCRNNRLAQLGLVQDGFTEAVTTSARVWGPQRVGVFLGTSTAGILETELAYRRRGPASGALPADYNYAATHNSFSVADFIRQALHLEGPAAVVCTACSSSAKVFASAQRLISAGVIDAAVVGGVDSLCLTTLYGFHSLQLTSRSACRPFDVARDGISIGEAAAFVLLERPAPRLDGDAIMLLGTGESSDAYHMSSPHPQGRGARAAIQQALSAANLAPGDIDYINLHGTATASNDSAEDLAVTSVFGTRTPCSSTKGATGHALGAAGALEAVICALAIQHELMPGGLNTTEVDPKLKLHYLCENRRGVIRRVLSNSFGFGGANCSLIFGRAD
ncbi:MAG TPA: beta-ketoacyl-[acyl-carrier-protein] synthase family protein [Steroidobacteraceae bacterium]|jgi:3-oxoacyl-[acyl-carrier-protein] synthase-1|nr:beta-ketoacyl-[acyl-carrier-protein] synthase family protein [Steroidobacteraceae bacterium]